MDIFKLEKPQKAGNINKIINNFNKSSYLLAANSPNYLYWDKVKYLPRPEGITAEEFWALIKLIRKLAPNRTATPVRDEKGNYFTWESLPGLNYFLHEIDMQLGGNIESSKFNSKLQSQRFITRGIMEEAIASSQLEGANTTRKAAKKMLLEKREPVNRSEHMILNNYRAMLEIEGELSDKNLTNARLLELHTILTQNTIPDTEVGRYRNDDDNIIVADTRSDMIYHIPPKESFFHDEIDRFLSFSNNDSDKKQFVHPVIKAIILHFWFAYLHPFTDGNGRLARAIFYWYLIKNGYWAFSFLPVSRVIRNSPAQYRDAYIYSEQDDNDLTYFIDYNIKKISQAKKEFENYLKRKEIENKKMLTGAYSKYNLNDRQIQLLRYLHKNNGATTTINLHANVYGVSRMTARADLYKLLKLGFLESLKRGREKPFTGTKKIAELFS